MPLPWRPVKWLAAALLVLALVLSGVSLGARGDPKKRITPADQARARAMLLRKSDFSLAFRAGPASTGADFYCAALDESDLTVTGQAESPSFRAGSSSRPPPPTCTPLGQTRTRRGGGVRARQVSNACARGCRARYRARASGSSRSGSSRSRRSRSVRSCTEWWPSSKGASASTWTSSRCSTREHRWPSSTGRGSHLRPRRRSAGSRR